MNVITALLPALACVGLLAVFFAFDKAREDRRRAAMTEDERDRDDEDQEEMSVW
jgi:hypothetical protein